MSTQPIPPARGAVDLSALSTGPSAPGRAAPTSGGPGASSSADGVGAAGPGVPDGLVIEVTDATLEEAMSRTMRVPAVLVLWAAQHPQTRDFVDDVIAVAAGLQGRLLVLTADLDASPALMQAFAPLLQQAFGQPAIPATFGLLQGQPVPLFPGVQPREQIALVFDKLLEAAVQNGIAGRVELGAAPGADGEEASLPPLHQEAFDAIERGDLAAAVAAYEQALADNPKDADAQLGLGQVRLMQRTDGVDLSAARSAAAERPEDVDAQTLVADLDLLGGHVQDAFLRLVDVVRATSGDDRERAKAHLIELFGVVGNHDERVKKGRTALMNALF